MVKDFYRYIKEDYEDVVKEINIKYGNPQKWQKESMEKGSDIFKNAKNSDLWEKWISKKPPLQDSEIVKKEIENLIMIGNSLTEEEKEFVKESEDDMLGVYLKFLKSRGIENISREDLETITESLDPITFSLKYHFNYPRPVQLALEHNLPLYPSQPTNACSPSYPSGHTIDSYVISGSIGKMIPDLYNELMDLASKISDSRNKGGIHFVFDSEFGKEIAEDILSMEKSEEI